MKPTINVAAWIMIPIEIKAICSIIWKPRKNWAFFADKSAVSVEL